MEDHEVIAVYQVDEPVFFADPPGPGTGEHVAQRFGNRFLRASLAVIDTSGLLAYWY